MMLLHLPLFFSAPRPSPPPPSPSPPSPPPSSPLSFSSSKCHGTASLSKRATLFLLASAPFLHLSPSRSARAENEPSFPYDDPDQDEERVVNIYKVLFPPSKDSKLGIQDDFYFFLLLQEASPSVVFIKDLALQAKPGRKIPSSSSEGIDDGEEWSDAKVEGTGSGFVWDKAGHIVTNYHVVEKLATDSSGLQRCKVYLEDFSGNTFSREGKLIGLDPSYDLAVLKVDVEGDKLSPANIGTSHDLRVGQSCYAIGNPYGYEHTLTTGVVSGLGREIPSPNGRPIRGAVQTDAAINAGNSGGPLMDSYGHVIGVNTSTFTRKGTGVSSGVNFAIPIDVVVKTVPYLILYGTPVSDRF